MEKKINLVVPAGNQIVTNQMYAIGTVNSNYYFIARVACSKGWP